MGELEMEQEYYLISLMIFLKVCDFEIQQQNNMPWEWCSCQSKPSVLQKL
jgi:hypothetical protein